MYKPAAWRWCALCWLLCLAPAAFAEPQTPVDFAAAVHMALNANPRAAASAASVDAAEGAVTAARGAALPKLGLELDATRSNNPLNVFGYRLAERQASFADFGLGEYAGADSLDTVPGALNQPGYANNYDTGVVLRIPLFAGGAQRARIREAQSLLAAANAGDRQARALLTYDVLQAYAGVHATAALVSAAQQTLDSASSDLKTAQSLYRQGIVIESDVLLAEAHRESARAVLAAAQAGTQDQLASFRTLLGQPGSDLVPGAAVSVALPEGSLAVLEQRALASNPELRVLQAQSAVSEAALDATRAADWPQLGLSLRHDWNADGLALRAPSNTIMATLSWELFSSGAQSGANRRARAEARRSAAEYAAGTDTVRVALGQALRAAQTAATELDASTLAAEHSAEAAHLLALRYAQGLTTLATLLDGAARRDAARAARVQAGYRALMARAQLRLLTDQLDPSAFPTATGAAAETNPGTH